MAAEPTGVFQALGLDGRLFAAQVFNAVLVLLILWRIVFRPLGRMMRERQEIIEKGLADAETAKHSLETWKAQKKKWEKAMEQEMLDLRKAEVARGEREARILIEKAQQEAERLLAEGRARLDAEKALVLKNAQKELVETAVSVAETLMGEGTPEHHEQLIARAVKALEKNL